MRVTVGLVKRVFSALPLSTQVIPCDVEKSLIGDLVCVSPSEVGDDFQVVLGLHTERPPGCKCKDLKWKDVSEVMKNLPDNIEVHIIYEGLSFPVHGIMTDAPVAVAKRIFFSVTPFPQQPVSAEKPLYIGPAASPEGN